MKGSSATSARATVAPRPTGQSSARPRPTPTSAEEFALSGPSDLPDPEYNAYRKDLADIALAGRVIASHYAEPLERRIAMVTELREGPSADAASIRQLRDGDRFLVVDESRRWAWGYAGEDGRVGYVGSDALAPQDTTERNQNN